MLIWDELCYKLSKSKKYELVLVMFDCGGGDTAVLVVVVAMMPYTSSHLILTSDLTCTGAANAQLIKQLQQPAHSNHSSQNKVGSHYSRQAFRGPSIQSHPTNIAVTTFQLRKIDGKSMSILDKILRKKIRSS